MVTRCLVARLVTTLLVSLFWPIETNWEPPKSFGEQFGLPLTWLSSCLLRHFDKSICLFAGNLHNSLIKHVIPYTMNGKRIEIVVRGTVSGRPANVGGTAVNPEYLDEYGQFINLPQTVGKSTFWAWEIKQDTCRPIWSLRMKIDHFGAQFCNHDVWGMNSVRYLTRALLKSVTYSSR